MTAGSASIEKAETQERELRDELSNEFRVAQADWAAIRRRYNDTVRVSGREAGVASVVAGLAGHIGGLVTGMLGLAMPFVLHLMRADAARRSMHGEQREFRLRVPMSVFIDLEEAERASAPRFFSE